MIDSIIKNLGLIICAIYTYYKMLNLNKPSLKKYILYSIFTPATAIISALIGADAKYFSTVIIVFLSTILFIFSSNTKADLSITATIISYAISYISFTICAFLSSAILWASKADPNFDLTYMYAIMIFVQFVIVSIPYKFKRLKKGMPFLVNKDGSGLGGLILSSIILFIFMLAYINIEEDLTLVIILISIIVLSVLVFLWWRNRITNSYLERLRVADIKRLEDSVQEKDNRIKQLEEDNQRLAKIIHKDNKLIPAMGLAVRSFIMSGSDDTDTLEAQRQGLLTRLDEMSAERSGIVKSYQAESKKLPETGVYSIDAILTYMLNKANENDINFDVTLSSNIKHMAENIISESDLNTLLADLIENAIIATKNCENKNIVVNFGIFDNNYFLDVLDSGIPFEIDTLVNFGLQKASTHLEDGGSGIGLMQTYEFKRKYKATIVIEEFQNANSLFTKRLSVIFDKRNKYIIKSPRANKISSKSIRNDLFVINSGK